MTDSPMYRAFVEVVPEASGFTGALTGQVAAASGTAGVAGGTAMAGGIGKGLAKAAGVIGAAIAALSLGDYILDAIGSAGDYEQNVGAIEDVFGGATDAVLKFSDTSAKTFGLSANQALTGAKNFGIFGKAAGLSGDDLATFSTDLLGLGADLAAFGNTSPEEAVTALAAGLRGESEPLRKYGVLLDDNTLRAKAMELGIYDGNGALTSQQKILAANAAIFEQTATQQGQFADESDTLAGKQAILAASWEDIGTKLGTAFLPIAQQVTDYLLNNLLPAVEDFAEWMNSPEVQEWISGVVTGWEEAKPTLDGIATFFQGLVDFLVGVFTLDLGKAWDGIVGIFTGAGQAILNGLEGWGENISDWLTGANQWIVDTFGDIGVDAIAGLIDGFLQGSVDLYNTISDVVGGAIGWAKDLLGIQSPSKVFAEMGAYSAEGYAQGLRSNYRMVQAAAGGMGMAGMSGASVTQNVTLRSDDPRLAVRQMSREMERALAAV